MDLESFDKMKRFENGEVDVMGSSSTVDLELDVLEPSTGVGKSFSQPIFYDGLTFAGRPP